MIFRELRIEASDEVKDQDIDASDSPFRWTAHHVREIFSAMLPRNFTLDGSSVIQITCGPRGSEPQYRQVFGSSEYFVENFDFSAYKTASPSEKESMLLNVIEKALFDIGERAGSDSSVIRSVLEEIRAHNFRKTIEIKKLSKKVPNSSYRLRVYRSLSKEEGETWILRFCDQGGQVIQETIMGKSPNYIKRDEFYSSAEIQGEKYIVRNRLGKETFSFNFGQIEGTA